MIAFVLKLIISELSFLGEIYMIFEKFELVFVTVTKYWVLIDQETIIPSFDIVTQLFLRVLLHAVLRGFVHFCKRVFDLLCSL